MRSDPPIVLVLAGCNGAGKTTSASLLLPALGIEHFVNADVIARGLSAFDPESVAFTAGRLMLERIDELAAARESFAFETTLSARSFASLLRRLKATGYRVQIAYVWLNRPELALERVADRVRRGGHHVPDEVVRRRYHGGIRNLLTLYQQIADRWVVYDNSGNGIGVIAYRLEGRNPVVTDGERWTQFQQMAESQTGR
jgi:predicted ABC-type ATPase